MEVYTVKDYKKVIDGYLEEKVIIVPTDTIYGMTCVIGSSLAKARIFKIKSRLKKNICQLLLIQLIWRIILLIYHVKI